MLFKICLKFNLKYENNINQLFFFKKNYKEYKCDYLNQGFIKLMISYIKKLIINFIFFDK